MFGMYKGDEAGLRSEVANFGNASLYISVYPRNEELSFI